jgi:TP901 family phage tail tape measure protein
MSSGPVATASVKIVPDLTGFQALLQSEVNKAVSNVQRQMKPLVASVTTASNAAAGTAAAGVRSSAGASAGKAAGGVNALTKESQALRGTLIGLSHITPVTVFGLGLYGTAALAAGLAVKSAIASTADFEHQLNVLQATTGATAEEMTAISAEAKKLGADLTLPATSAGDAARAMTELAKAGLTIQETLKGARGVLQLAAAAQIDVGTAAEFVATELNAFGLSGDKAVHVADLLAGASIAAQGDIRDFGTAFQQVSAVAHGANVSLETTTGLLTELARAGLRGADAGTSIRTFLLRLTPTTKQAAEYQKALNIRLDDTKTIGEQLPKLIGQYQRALEGVSPVLRQQALTQIFGQDAIRAATILINGGTEALNKNTRAANQQGAASRLAEANAKGLSGAFNGLRSNADTLGITVGNVVSGPLTGFVKGLSSIVSGADKAAGALGRFNKKSDEFFNFKIPGTGETGTSFSDKAVKTIVTPFEFWRVAFKTIDDTVIAAIQQGRQTAQHEKELADLIKNGGIFGVAALDPTHPDRVTEPGEGSTRPSAAQAAADAAVSKNAAATEARIRAIQADKNKRKVKTADITPSRDLQIAQLNAQLTDSLQDDLTADKAIENYFRKRLKLAIKGTLRYKEILAALTQAHAATKSVQDQINSDSKQAQQDQQTAIDDAVSLQRTRLENAAELANHQGEAERKLIAFYLAESKDLRLEESARLSYAAAYNSERKQQQAMVVAQAKAEIDLRNSRLDLAIQRAGLTPGIGDDRRAINAKIRRLQQDIKDIQKLKNLTIEQKQQIVDLQSAILSLQAQAKNLNDAQQGFSLQDLFKEAAGQFATFGSNISARNGVLSGQDERAAFSKSVLNSRDRSASLAGQQLNAQEKTNSILEQILAKIGHTGGGGVGGSPALAGKGKKGNLLAIYGTEIAAAYNYGVN